LLGLLVDGTNVGLSVLHALDVDASVVRQRVLELVAPDQLRLRASERKLGRLAALTRDPEQSARHEEILAIYRVALREIAPARQAEVEARKAAVKTLADACESAVATAAKELTGLDLGLD
jgi:hypothetical protein